MESNRVVQNAVIEDRRVFVELGEKHVNRKFADKQRKRCKAPADFKNHLDELR